MKICVTGGAGFVGSHLVDALVEDGHDVIVIDHFKREKKRFLNDSAKVYKISVADEGLEQVFEQEKPDVVCHLAAQISVTESVKDPVHDARVNILDALSLLEVAQRTGVQKIIFASSGGAIYGDHDELPTPELEHAEPISPYGIAKQSFEQYLQALHLAGGPLFINLRFANIYGPRQLPKNGGEAGVVAIFLDRLKKGEDVSIFGDGSSTRDYVYVSDAVEAFKKAIEAEQDGTYNISTGVETSVLDLWNTLKEIHGTEHDHAFAPAREGEILRSALNPEKAKSGLGWSPKVTVFDGLKEAHRWFMEEFEE